MLITFDTEKTKALLELSKSASERQPNFEQRYVTKYLRKDLSRERRAFLESQLPDAAGSSGSSISGATASFGSRSFNVVISVRSVPALPTRRAQVS